MNYLDDWKVTVPEGSKGVWTIDRFEVERESLERLRLQIHGRGCPPGTYTRLRRNGYVVMSDTAAEVRDHFEPKIQMQRREAKRVLIHGLGLGMVLQQALRMDHVEHVDVVEIDPDVIELIGPHYTAMAGGRLHLHEGDAYTYKFPVGTTWDIAWHDIWDTLSQDNLELMATLHRRYGSKVGWQGSWGKAFLKYERRRSGW